MLLACPFVPVMLVGVVLSPHRRVNLGRLSTTFLAPMLAATNLTLTSTTKVVPTSLEYRLTFLATTAIFVAIWKVGGGWRRHAVGDINDPLYVVHPVLDYALRSIMTVHGVPALVAALAAAIAALSAAWLLHILVETPTHRLGQRLARNIAYVPGTDPTPARA